MSSHTLSREETLRKALLPLAGSGITVEETLQLVRAIGGVFTSGLGLGWTSIELIITDVLGPT